ncbi:MAG: hypothetical protein NVS3B24_21520 [Candidatus Dormibacteria bacterium]
MPAIDTNTTIKTRGDLEITQSRVFDAPRELVFTTMNAPPTPAPLVGPVLPDHHGREDGGAARGLVALRPARAGWRGARLQR